MLVWLCIGYHLDVSASNEIVKECTIVKGVGWGGGGVKLEDNNSDIATVVLAQQLLAMVVAAVVVIRKYRHHISTVGASVAGDDDK
jgi:hypothetical protein